MSLKVRKKSFDCQFKINFDTEEKKSLPKVYHMVSPKMSFLLFHKTFKCTSITILKVALGI